MCLGAVLVHSISLSFSPPNRETFSTPNQRSCEETLGKRIQAFDRLQFCRVSAPSSSKLFPWLGRLAGLADSRILRGFQKRKRAARHFLFFYFFWSVIIFARNYFPRTADTSRLDLPCDPLGASRSATPRNRVERSRSPEAPENGITPEHRGSRELYPPGEHHHTFAINLPFPRGLVFRRFKSMEVVGSPAGREKRSVRRMWPMAKGWQSSPLKQGAIYQSSEAV